MIAVDFLFLFVYLMSLFFKFKGYFKKWDIIENDEDCKTYAERRKNLITKRLKLQFDLQMSRYICWYTFLIVLNIIKTVTNQLIINHADDVLQCRENDKGWCFTSCAFTTPVFMTHVLTTMQTAGIVRAVFIKTTKKYAEGMQEEAKQDLKKTFKSIFDLSHQKEDDLEKHLSHEEIEEIE